MMMHGSRHRSRWIVLILLSVLSGCGSEKSTEPPKGNASRNELQPDADGKFHVHPGEDIQRALNAAARSEQKVVVVHEGEYRPQFASQAMIRFQKQHDGVTLIADGGIDGSVGVQHA